MVNVFLSLLLTRYSIFKKRNKLTSKTSEYLKNYFTISMVSYKVFDL